MEVVIGPKWFVLGLTEPGKVADIPAVSSASDGVDSHLQVQEPSV